jgi:hypothetical protein
VKPGEWAGKFQFRWSFEWIIFGRGII